MYKQIEGFNLGVEFKGYKDKPEEAIEKLIKEKRGHIKDALYRKETGYIMLLWGENNEKNKGYGLKHIIEKRTKVDKIDGLAFAKKIPDIVKNGIIAEIKPNRIYFQKDNNMVSVKTVLNDKNVKWVITGFEVF